MRREDAARWRLLVRRPHAVRPPAALHPLAALRLSRQDQRTAEGALLHNMLPTSAQFATELGAAGVSDESHIVLYSSTKVMWATRVWWMLRSFGFRGELSVLDGGLKAWTAAGGEVAQLEEVRIYGSLARYPPAYI